MRISPTLSPPLALLAIALGLSVMSCVIVVREEIVAGVPVPIPAGMSRTADHTIGLAIPGFGAGQVTFRGKMDTDEIVAFYQEEMAARGWWPNAGLVARGALLAYSRENKSVLIMVSPSESGTILALMVIDIGY